MTLIIPGAVPSAPALGLGHATDRTDTTMDAVVTRRQARRTSPDASARGITREDVIAELRRLGAAIAGFALHSYSFGKNVNATAARMHANAAR